MEAQSKAADLEDRLLQTETQLVNVKASWAESEHEKEQILGKLSTIDEVLSMQYEGGIEGFLQAINGR